jgi:hypothetical protein
MPSNNSYTYYTRFLRCLERYLEKKIEKRKKEAYIVKPEIFYYSIDRESKPVSLTAKIIYAAFGYIFDDLIEKAPSAAMGADDWLDKFFIHVVDEAFCTETWCGHDRCKEFDHVCPYNCGDGKLPSKCEKWKAWRLTWRSYPDKEECQKCRYYKPVPNIDPRYRTDLQTKQINEYKCYCRAKELPENCPKRKKENKKGKK